MASRTGGTGRQAASLSIAKCCNLRIYWSALPASRSLRRTSCRLQAQRFTSLAASRRRLLRRSLGSGTSRHTTHSSCRSTRMISSSIPGRYSEAPEDCEGTGLAHRASGGPIFVHEGPASSPSGAIFEEGSAAWADPEPHGSASKAIVLGSAIAAYRPLHGGPDAPATSNPRPIPAMPPTPRLRLRRWTREGAATCDGQPCCWCSWPSSASAPA